MDKLIKRKGRKKATVFRCRKGNHIWVDTGSTGRSVNKVSFKWCRTCGCLGKTEGDSEDTIILMPDTGI